MIMARQCCAHSDRPVASAGRATLVSAVPLVAVGSHSAQCARNARLACRGAVALRKSGQSRLRASSSGESATTVATANGTEQTIRVAVFSAAPFVHDFLETPLSAAFDTRFFEPRLNKDTALLAQGCNTVCLFVNDDCDAEVCQLLAAAGVKLIAMRCAGFDRVDVAAATALGMSVVRVPSYSPHAIAEHAVALLMCLNRSLHKAYARVREGNFTLNGLQGFDVHGKTVGIIGTGKIGTITGGILGRGFGARLLGYDAYPSAEFSALGGEYVSLDELLAQSDIISLHAPLNKSTFHLLAAPQVAKMKRGVFIINTSRGGLLDTRAMIDGLESGVIGALGIDVYEDEGPLFFKDFSLLSRGRRMQGWDEIMGMLLSLPNVLVSPHIAFLTTEALDNIACTTIDNIKAYARGEELKNVVKP